MKAGEDAGIRCFFVCSSILLGYRGCRLMVETRTRADPVFVCGRIRVETEKRLSGVVLNNFQDVKLISRIAFFPAIPKSQSLGRDPQVVGGDNNLVQNPGIQDSDIQISPR